MMKEREKNNNRKKEMMSRVDIKMMHSNELRELKKMIQEELNFRDDIGKEIQQTHNQPVSHHYKIEDSLFTKEEEERIRIYEEKN